MKKIVFTLLCLNLLTAQAQQSWNQVIRAVSSDHSAGDRYGASVSISGNYAVVGALAEWHDVNGNNPLEEAGAVYVLERDLNGNWVEKQKLVAPIRKDYDNFGQSVSISGDYIVIGAPYEDEDASEATTIANAGSAYIFERNNTGTWVLLQKIVASDRETGDNFGSNVSINNDYIIVGAPAEDHNVAGSASLNNAGSIYIFERVGTGNWSQKQKLVASDRAASDQYGSSVSISGDYAIVGTKFKTTDVSGSNVLSLAGAAYILERNTSGVWSQKQKIVASDRVAGGNFGISVSINDDNAIVGATGQTHDASGNNSLYNAGAAYIFNRSSSGTWSQAFKFTSSDRATDDLLGSSVSINNDRAIIGSRTKNFIVGNDTTHFSGAAYILKYESGSWALDQKIVPTTKVDDQQFGNAVSIDADYALVGSYSPSHEAAYIFEFDCTPSTSTDVKTSCGPYVWIDGNTYSSNNNTATFTITGGASTGCDSIVTLNLTITSVINTVSTSWSTITADQTGATYQWIDCGNSNNPISGATSQSYTATADGSYAVIITNGTCSDTSACVVITNASIKENSLASTSIYPNPSKGTFTIEAQSNMQLNITDLTGRTISSQSITTGKNKIVLNENTGVYLLNFVSENGKHTERILIK